MGAFFSKSKKKEIKQIGREPTEDFIKLTDLTVKPLTNTELTIKFPTGETKECTTKTHTVHSNNPYDFLAKCNDGSDVQLNQYYQDNNLEIKINKVESRIRGGKRRFSKKNKKIGGKWSMKYKKSINCNHPKGFSQKQHCKYGRKSKKNIKK